MTDLDLRKHGIDASQLAIRPGEIAEFNLFLAGLYADLRPNGEIQRQLFGQILHASWNMRLARQQEAQMLLAGGVAQPGLRQVLQFYRACEREYFKAVSELRNLQSELAYRATLAGGQNSGALPDIPPLVLTAQVHKQVRTATGARLAFDESTVSPKGGRFGGRASG